MSDDPLSKPPRVPVTAEWLAEQERKQAAYVEGRRRYRAAFLRHGQEEAEPAEEATPADTTAGPPRRRGRGKINDPRQLRLEL